LQIPGKIFGIDLPVIGLEFILDEEVIFFRKVFGDITTCPEQNSKYGYKEPGGRSYAQKESGFGERAKVMKKTGKDIISLFVNCARNNGQFLFATDDI